ncbi:MAG: MazG nucleotide pyrophosphohydrolase domain-containing protein [Desulfopila sp.]|jgi:uncharacterized protein YabN with tetrapyrrole methylase and pyrophosphatase domain|nr:MazG nucleotide pyrophosphohydrolase domain-containing protein [Desulfopila sp.]
MLEIDKLLHTIQKLRSRDGCPWDIKQTLDSLQKYLAEEVEELHTAIIQKDHDNICEEIGDVLYVLLMLAEIEREQGNFTIADCIRNIDAKLLRRHPHVFENKAKLSEKELRLQWEKIKSDEKKRNI